MKRVLLIAAVVLATLAGSARAETLHAAYGQAVRFWGQRPACEVTIIVKRLRGADGESEECSIWIDPRVRNAPGQLCLTMTHELGHVLGYEHSPDPRSVMYPTAQLSSAPICERTEHAHFERSWHRWESNQALIRGASVPSP